MRGSAPFPRQHDRAALDRQNQPVETTLTLKTDSCRIQESRALGLTRIRMPRPPRNRTGRSRPAGPYKHGAIPVIGLIGAIGAGKSRVAALLAGSGAFVIDADVVGHALLDQRPVRERVVAQFGARVLERPAAPDDPARVDRRALGTIVFSDPAALRRLESIVHPRMRRTFERAIARTVRRGQARAVVLDAAILFEAGWHTLCDRIVLIDAPREQRLERLAAARGWGEQTLARREAAQWPLERKRALADTVIVNDSSIESLEARVHSLADAVFPPSRLASVRSPGGSALPPGPRAAAGSGPDHPADSPWSP
jgi:dephospho-CoA kinase